MTHNRTTNSEMETVVEHTSESAPEQRGPRHDFLVHLIEPLREAIRQEREIERRELEKREKEKAEQRMKIAVAPTVGEPQLPEVASPDSRHPAKRERRARFNLD